MTNFDTLHAGVDPAEVRVDAGDGLEPGRSCSFQAGGGDPAPCPLEPSGDPRQLSGREFPACPWHSQAGGFLHREARAAFYVWLVEQMNGDSRATGLAVAGDEALLTYPTRCSGCGCRIFTGNAAGKCTDCA